MALDTVVVIQATLAPIFLVSGAAIFLNFTQARLFRVIDRLRALSKDIKVASSKPEKESLAWQRSRQLKRAILLRNSILFGVLVIMFTVATTLLILVPAEWGSEGSTARWALATFTLALVSFAVALVLVTLDAFLSVAAVRHMSREFAVGPDESS